MAIDPIGAAPGASSATAGGELPGFAGGWEGLEPGPPAQVKERLERELSELDARDESDSEASEEEREDRDRRRKAIREWLGRLEARRREEEGAHRPPEGPLGTRFDESA